MQPWPQIMIAAFAINRDLRYAVAPFRVSFFDWQFFALRFPVVSQYPEFDSQTAMRNWVNYIPQKTQSYGKFCDACLHA